MSLDDFPGPRSLSGLSPAPEPQDKPENPLTRLLAGRSPLPSPSPLAPLKQVPLELRWDLVEAALARSELEVAKLQGQLAQAKLSIRAVVKRLMEAELALEQLKLERNP